MHAGTAMYRVCGVWSASAEGGVWWCTCTLFVTLYPTRLDEIDPIAAIDHLRLGNAGFSLAVPGVSQVNFNHTQSYCPTYIHPLYSLAFLFVTLETPAIGDLTSNRPLPGPLHHSRSFYI